MPDPKHHRSDYTHWDSTEPDMWERLIAALKDVEVTGIDNGNVVTQFGDSGSIDAFARLRVSNPTTLFDSSLQYDLHRIHWEDQITDSSGNADVTFDSDFAEAQMYVEASDEIIRQTRRYFRYQPGKSQLLFMTFVMGSADSALEQRVGYYDDDNGIFFTQNGTDYQIVRRSSTSGSAVDEEVSQASWNIDPFDGTGPSGYTLDFTKAHIFFMDMEWLGVGRVRAGFVIDGIPYYAHQFLHANIVTSVYMTTANLPIRYEILATAGLTGGKTLQAICSSISSEGGFHISTGLQFSISNETTLRTVTSAAHLPLVAIRPKLTFNSIVNRGRIIPSRFGLFSNSNTVHYNVYWGATISGGAWVSVGDDSIVEYNITGTSQTGGIPVTDGYVPSSVQSRGSATGETVDDYPLTLDIDGAHPTSPYTDIWVVGAEAVGNNSDCGASIEFRELR